MAYCEDAPCCGCCNPREMMTAPEPFDDWEEEDSRVDEEPEDSMDGDHASALASAGMGTDEDYTVDLPDDGWDDRYEGSDEY